MARHSRSGSFKVIETGTSMRFLLVVNWVIFYTVSEVLR